MNSGSCGSSAASCIGSGGGSRFGSGAGSVVEGRA
jgi:hypothetical protein